MSRAVSRYAAFFGRVIPRRATLTGEDRLLQVPWDSSKAFAQQVLRDLLIDQEVEVEQGAVRYHLPLVETSLGQRGTP